MFIYLKIYFDKGHLKDLYFPKQQKIKRNDIILCIFKYPQISNLKEIRSLLSASVLQ